MIIKKLLDVNLRINTPAMFVIVVCPLPNATKKGYHSDTGVHVLFVIWKSLKVLLETHLLNFGSKTLTTRHYVGVLKCCYYISCLQLPSLKLFARMNIPDFQFDGHIRQILV